MKGRGTPFIGLTLVTISLIPPGIYLYQFVNSGGLGWPMIWGNELIVWCAIFSLPAAIALVDAIQQRNTQPKTSLVVCIIATCVISGTFISLVNFGTAPASKADDNTLKLLEFWSSGWWK